MSQVVQAWQRIQKWLSENVPELADKLPGPAELAQVETAEQAMGMALPAELRESYLLHDGQEYGELELNIFPTPADAYDDMAFCLLPIARVADEWKVWKDLIDGGDFEGEFGEPASGIADAWWSDGWIPVAGNGGGDFLCVDMRPAAGGTVGQVICAWHDDAERHLLAPSWGSYLEQLAADLESGSLHYSQDEGLVRE